MRGDDVALALIEARLTAAREQHLVTQIRRSRREARRAQRSDRAPRWWVLRSRTGDVRVWTRVPWRTFPGLRPAAWLRR
jgi:hypothetical protein